MLFPTGRSGLYEIEVGRYRTGEMQVISGAMGHEHIHYQAPGPERVPTEMQRFIDWVNKPAETMGQDCPMFHRHSFERYQRFDCERHSPEKRRRRQKHELYACPVNLYPSLVKHDAIPLCAVVDATGIFDGTQNRFQGFVVMLAGDEVVRTYPVGKDNAAMITAL